MVILSNHSDRMLGGRVLFFFVFFHWLWAHVSWIHKVDIELYTLLSLKFILQIECLLLPKRNAEKYVGPNGRKSIRPYIYPDSHPFLDTLNFLSSISKPSNRTPWETQPIGHNTTVGLTMPAALVQLYRRLKTPWGLGLSRVGVTLLLDGAISELMIWMRIQYRTTVSFARNGLIS